FDPVGGAAFDAALRLAGPLGRILVIGFASGAWPMIPANILLVKNVDVLGFYFGRYIWEGVLPRIPWDDQVKAAFDQLFAWYELGLLRPLASERFSLKDYRIAMQCVT